MKCLVCGFKHDGNVEVKDYNCKPPTLHDVKKGDGGTVCIFVCPNCGALSASPTNTILEHARQDALFKTGKENVESEQKTLINDALALATNAAATARAHRKEAEELAKELLVVKRELFDIKHPAQPKEDKTQQCQTCLAACRYWQHVIEESNKEITILKDCLSKQDVEIKQLKSTKYQNTIDVVDEWDNSGDSLCLKDYCRKKLDPSAKGGV